MEETQIEAQRRLVREKQTDYQLTFQTSQPSNVKVLEDLAEFCRANESCVVPGDRDKTLILEGRREVWLRISQMLGLAPDEAFAYFSGLLRRRMNNG